MLIVLLLLVLACAAIFAGRTAKYNAYKFVPLRASPVTRPETLPAGTPYFPPPALKRSYFDWQVLSRTLKRDGPPFWIACAGCAAWPWATLVVLMIFRVSMRRAKVNTQHVLRSVLYSGDAFLWPALLLAVSLWVIVALTATGIIYEPIGGWLPKLSMASLILCFLPVLKLWAAYQRYLRFRHAFWMIVASQMIVFLGTVVVIMMVSSFTYG